MNKHMIHPKIVMEHDKKIALVAHDNKKKDLFEWAKYNKTLLAHHTLYATGTTGLTLQRELDLKVNLLQSGPLGGEQQIGAKIVDNDIDFLIFFWDPLTDAARPRRQSAPAHGGGVEYSHCLQSRLGRFYYLLPADGCRISSSCRRLQ